jgi:Fur family transcriptional regulator, ferric uptake regulator
MKIENIIEEKNFKLTSARKELLELLSKEVRPVSFEDIKEKLNMDKATFYRNIIKFENESLVSSFESNDKKRYYELKDSSHAHFICKSCNTIECLKDVKSPHIEGYEIEDVILKGICQECIAK